MPKAIKSFTIIELIMTLIISAILISIVYYTYAMFTRQFGKQRIKDETMNEFLLLQKAINSDFERADKITDSTDSHYRLNLNSSNGDIMYKFEDSIICRTTETNIDTFHFSMITHKSDYLDNNVPLIVKFIVKVRIQEETIDIILNKRYCATQAMAGEKNHE